MKEEDREGLIASEFFVGELSECREFDLGDFIEKFLEFGDVNGVHLGVLDFEGFFQENIEAIFLQLNHFGLNCFPKSLPACPQQIQPCSESDREFLEGGQGVHDLGNAVDVIGWV